MPPAPGSASAGEAAALNAAQAQMGPRATAQRAAIAQAHKDKINSDPTLEPKYKEWYNEQADNYKNGLPIQTYTNWKIDTQNAPALALKANDAYEKDYRGKDQKADEIIHSVAALANIAKNPRFAPGEPGYIDEVTSLIGSVNDKLKSINVPESMLLSADQVKNITEPTALREAYRAISNQAVIAMLGGLGRQISDPDRKYMADAFSSLLMTKGGSEKVMGFMSEVADRYKLQAQVARDYLKDNPRATTAGLDQRVQDAVAKKYGDKGLLAYGNGNPTQLRLKIDKALQEEAKAAAQTPPPASSRRTSPPNKRFRGPDGGIYIMGPNGTMVPEQGNGNSL